MTPRARAIRAAGVALALAIGSHSTAAFALRPELTQEYLPDVSFAPRIAAKAAELGNDHVRIFEFVRNEIDFEVYYGLMKGPEATLLSGAGNDYDQAALLVSLLRVSNFPARFVRGRIRIPGELARAWTGAEPEGAEGPGAGAVELFQANDPPNWNGEAELEATSHGGGNFVSKLQIWVEAYVPLGNYRGAGGPGNPGLRGPAWVPLDPSFTPYEWESPSPPIPIYIEPTANPPGVSVDYFGPDGLYAGFLPEHPLEIFEDQVRDYLAAHRPGVSLAEATLRREIRTEAPGALPTTLPYEIRTGTGVFPQIRHWDLGELHASSDDTFKLAGENGAEDYRYMRHIHLCTGGTEDCEDKGAGEPGWLMSASNASAAWQTERLTLWFEPTHPNAMKPEGYAADDCKGIAGLPVTLTPTVSYGGTAHATGSIVELCDPLRLVLETTGPLGVGSNLTLLAEDELHAGDLYLASFDEGGASDALVAEAANSLVWLAPYLAHDPIRELAFLDVNQNGVMDTGEAYLAADPAANESITGTLLHLAHAWWWNQYRNTERRITALHDRLGLLAPGAGTVSSGREIEFLFDIPFGVGPDRLSTNYNVPSLNVERTVREVGQPFSASPHPSSHIAQLQAHQLSALEHAVWEEIGGTAAASTVKILQIVGQLGDPQIELLRIQSTAEADEVIDDRCNSNGCDCGNCGTGMDFTTYCTIVDVYPDVSEGPTGWRAACPDFYSGNSTTDLRILNRSTIDYHGWIGHVSASTHADQIRMSLLAASNGSEVADYVIDPELPDPSGVELPFDPLSFQNETPASIVVSGGDPVSVTHGSYFESNEDIRIPGRGGMDLRLVRSYNSRIDHAGLLGHGWIHTFEQHLVVDERFGHWSLKWMTENATEEPWYWGGIFVGEFLAPAWNHHDLVKNPDESWTLTTKEGMVYEFLPAPDAANGPSIAKLDSITDRHGNTITCQYTGQGLLTQVVDSAGRALTFTYLYFLGVPISIDTIVDWTGRVWDYDVDLLTQDLVGYTDPEGHTWSYTYYSGLTNPELNHNIKSFERPADRDGDHYRMEFDYYPNDTVYRHTDALGRETRFSYNLFRKRTDVIHPDGGVETYYYDTYGNTTRYESPEGAVTLYEFDEEKRERIREVDPLGFETLFTYTGNGDVETRTDRLGNVESWTYNAFGQALTWTDRNGNHRGWLYGPEGQLLRESADLDGAILVTLRTHGYDSFGNRTSTTETLGDGRQATTTFEYHPSGVGIEKIIDADLNETRFTLDDLGRPVATEVDRTIMVGGNPVVEPIVTTRVFDGLDRVISETDPNDVTREFDFDPNGLLEEVRTTVPDPGQAGPIVRVDLVNGYDAMDRLVSVQNALGYATQFGYDERDRRSRRRAPSAGRARWSTTSTATRSSRGIRAARRRGSRTIR